MEILPSGQLQRTRQINHRYSLLCENDKSQVRVDQEGEHRYSAIFLNTARELKARLAKSGTFLRDATGLVREMSLFDAVNVGYAAAAPMLSVAYNIAAGALIFPGANMVYSIGVLRN